MKNAPGTQAPGAFRPWWETAGLLALSGVVMCASFVPGVWGVGIWMALVPALVAARGAPLKRLFFLSWVVGYLSSLFLYYWMAIVTWQGWLLLTVYVGLYQPVFLVGVEVLARRFRVPRVASAVCLWPLLEFARSILLTGLPWFYLGHALYRWPRLIQSADIAGVIFLGMIVIAVNALLARALAASSDRRRRTAAVALAAAVFAANLAYGAWRFAGVDVRPGPMVGIVQPNVPQSLKITQTARDSARIFAELRTATLGDQLCEADVIFWPETIMPGLVGVRDYTVANGMSGPEMLAEFVAQGAIDQSQADQIVDAVAAGADFVDTIEQATGSPMEKYLDTWNLFRATSAMAGRPLVAGAIAGVFNEEGRVVKTFNRVYHFDAHGNEVSRYDKVHLVPFGEFVPMRKSCPPVGRLLAAMMPVDPLVYPGARFVTFEIGGYRYGPAICFEDTFSYIGRQYRRQDSDILLNLTNDGWFADSFELEAHLANAVFRAVETRMGVVRAANTGVSAVISPRGEVTARLTDCQGRDRQVMGTLVARVQVSADRSLYVVAGHWWLWVPAAVLMGFVVWCRRAGI
ncbi:MAG: apolipoprotein N-acyltransferase [Planctomycetes bacterium]|nr:apolipoprotein N-acyltransferase [Planctomycetota bacterium]